MVRPPGTSMQPVNAMMEKTARSKWPTLVAWHAPAELLTNVAGVFSQTSLTAASSFSLGTQVISSTFSGVYPEASSLSSSKPTVQFSTKSLS